MSRHAVTYVTAAAAMSEPEQYQVVHDTLMWAIADVLGDAVTPDIAAAWGEVYWLMAYTLILTYRLFRGKVRLTEAGGHY